MMKVLRYNLNSRLMSHKDVLIATKKLCSCHPNDEIDIVISQKTGIAVKDVS